MSEKKDDILKNINESVKDFVKNLFGEKGVEMLEDTTKKVNEYSSQLVKSVVEFNDNLLESLKLNENEIVKKSSDQIKDLLKQAGLLKDEAEDEF